MVAINIAANTSSNLLAPGEDVGDMSPAERAHRIYGSKLVLVVEQMQCCTVWLIKACLLILYNRLTYVLLQSFMRFSCWYTNPGCSFQLRANYYVRLLAIYTAGSFVVMEILYFGVWCRPVRSPHSYQRFCITTLTRRSFRTIGHCLLRSNVALRPTTSSPTLCSILQVTY
jgi:hypothetical protein